MLEHLLLFLVYVVTISVVSYGAHHYIMQYHSDIEHANHILIHVFVALATATFINMGIAYAKGPALPEGVQRI